MSTTMKLIAKQVLTGTATSVTFSSIPGTYTDLLLVASVRTTRSASTDVLKMRFNGASSDTSHSARILEGSGSSATSASVSYATLSATNGDTSTANTFGVFEVYIPNYAGSTNKSYSASNVHETNASEAYLGAVAGLWSNTAAITSIEMLSAQTGTPSFKSGSSFFLYGITKA